MDRIVPPDWTVQNLDGYLIFDLEGYEMTENERRGECFRERTNSPVWLIVCFDPVSDSQVQRRSFCRDFSSIFP